MKDYRESHLDPDHAASYDAAFLKNPRRALFWTLEQRVLGDILNTRFSGRPIRLLDFACGSGRILALLEDGVQEAVGVDVSPSMIAIARRKSHKAQIIQGDLTRDDVLGDRRFDLITAFRFFPNAQPELRREVAKVLARHLERDGCLVFNNHMNTVSLLCRLERLLRLGSSTGMAPAEIHDFLDPVGLVVDRIYGIGWLPSYEHRLPLPAPLLCPIEACATRIGLFPGLAQDMVYVCKIVARNCPW